MENKPYAIAVRIYESNGIDLEELAEFINKKKSI